MHLISRRAAAVIGAPLARSLIDTTVAVLADAAVLAILAATVAVAGFRPLGVSSTVDLSHLRENSGPSVMRECG